MNYRGSYKKLLGNAIAAMKAAIEIYNKPVFKYRDECTVILIMNAWELLLKALVSKNKNSIYYPKKRGHPYRTLSWKDALSKGVAFFPKTIPTLPIQRNLALIDDYRNNAVHFYNAKDLGLVLYALVQTSILNFRDLLRDAFSIDLAGQLNWQLLPIGITPPIDLVSYLSKRSRDRQPAAVAEFLSELAQSVEDLEAANEDTDRLLTVFRVKLESVKKTGDSDAVVGIAADDQHDGVVTVTRIQDPNTSHPLRQKELVARIGRLHERKFTSYTFQAIVWKFGLRDEPRYCWKATEGVLTRYSHETVTFIRQLTPIQLDDAIADYKEYCRNRNQRRKQVR